MSKIVLFTVGVALFAVTGHYFLSFGSSSIVAKSTSKITTAIVVNSVAPLPELAPAITPIAKIKPKEKSPNPSDRLRFALESVVDDSAEQDLWD